MSIQNYRNHRKFYGPHHFVFLPLLAVLQVFSIWKIFSDDDNQLIWILFAVTVFLIIYLALMVRQHYALGNQNRIIRLEFRQRYFELYGKSADHVLDSLDFNQIAALRFAYDDEFRELLDKAVQQKLCGDEIKKSIKRWKPDNNRV